MPKNDEPEKTESAEQNELDPGISPLVDEDSEDTNSPYKDNEIQKTEIFREITDENH